MRHCFLALSKRHNCPPDFYHWFMSPSHWWVPSWCAALMIRLSQDWTVAARHNTQLLALNERIATVRAAFERWFIPTRANRATGRRSELRQKGHDDPKVEEKQSLFVPPLGAIEWPFIQRGTIMQSCALQTCIYARASSTHGAAC